MGNSNSAFFKVCGSSSKKNKKGTGKEEDEEDESESNKKCDDINIIRRNKDKYFLKEDYEKIMKKFPAFKEWVDQSENPQAIEKPKQRKIKFEELKIIGQGSCGRVFMGFDSEKGCIMAVKQVHLGDSVSPDQQERIESLETEINLLSMFSHKNIVKYYGSHRNENTLNIYLEYVSGGSIACLVQKYGAIPENLIRVYTLQILEGLEYLHVRNTIHRDIKGANILVDSTGVCKLADFGTAKRISSLVENDAKGMNAIKGTVNWMAPEIINQSSLGRFCDIWSVGCTVLEMATGKAPWSNLVKPNSTLVGTLYQIAKAKSPPPLPNNLSSVAIDFLKQCFRINPNERPNVISLLQHKFVTGIQSICPVIEQSCEEKEPLVLKPTMKNAAAHFTIKDKKTKALEQKVQQKKEEQGNKSQREGNAKSNSRESPVEEKYRDLEDKPKQNNNRILAELENDNENNDINNNIENNNPKSSKQISVSKKPSVSKTDNKHMKNQTTRPLGKSPRAAQAKKKGYANLTEEKAETINKTVKENISPENVKRAEAIYNFDENHDIKIEIKDNLLKSGESQERRKSVWWSQCSQCLPGSHENSRREEEKDIGQVQGKIFQSKDQEESQSRDSDHEFSAVNESPLKHSGNLGSSDHSASINRLPGGGRGFNPNDISSKLSVMKDSYLDGRGDLTQSEYNMSILRKRERNEKKIIIMMETPTMELSIIPRHNPKPSRENSDKLEQKVTQNLEESRGKENFDLRKYNISEDLNKIFPKFEANSSPLAF